MTIIAVIGNSAFKLTFFSSSYKYIKLPLINKPIRFFLRVFHQIIRDTLDEHLLYTNKISVKFTLALKLSPLHFSLENCYQLCNRKCAQDILINRIGSVPIKCQDNFGCSLNHLRHGLPANRYHNKVY